MRKGLRSGAEAAIKIAGGMFCGLSASFIKTRFYFKEEIYNGKRNGDQKTDL